MATHIRRVPFILSGYVDIPVSGIDDEYAIDAAAMHEARDFLETFMPEFPVANLTLEGCFDPNHKQEAPRG